MPGCLCVRILVFNRINITIYDCHYHPYHVPGSKERERYILESYMYCNLSLLLIVDCFICLFFLAIIIYVPVS
jgi:hypothetical protein